MLIGIVSDIHGNDAGLAAACGALRACGAMQIACCGDIVGYSARVREVIAIVRREEMICVAGNHDDMVTKHSWPRLNPLKSQPLQWAAEMLSDDDRGWLASLPIVLDWNCAGRRARLLHGMPADPLEGYFYPDLAFDAALPDGVEFLLVGHTHMQFRADKSNGAIINAGSCGLPRDGDPRAACMLFDTESGATTALRVLYDPSEVVAANERAGFDPVINAHLVAGQKTNVVAKKDVLLDAAASIASEGLNVVSHAAGLIAAADKQAGLAAIALQLADGTISIRSTPIAFAWQRESLPDPPEGFRIARTKIASYYEQVTERGDARAVADACLRVALEGKGK